MGSNRHYLRRGRSYLARNGIKLTFFKAVERLMRDRAESGYEPHKCTEEELEAQRAHVFRHPYRFSILVPVYETDHTLLRQMLDSVGNQTYAGWELILADASADDSRRNTVRGFLEDYNGSRHDSFGSIFDKVRYIHLDENKGISGNTNEALSHATGDYIGLLDHDDLLGPDALYEIMSAIEEKEEALKEHDSISRVLAVYTDEDKISEDAAFHFDPNFKPDFDPVMLTTNNYICHFFVCDINLARSVDGFCGGYDGAQDHDFILRCTEGVHRDQILHVPKVLYHWRSIKGSTSEDPEAKLYAYDAGKRAVADHLKRSGIKATVTDSPHLGFFEIKYDKLHMDVASLTRQQFEKIKKEGTDLPDTAFLLILSEDLSPEDPTYIEDMMSCMQLPFVGAVTGRIIGRDNRTESAGYTVLQDGTMQPEHAGVWAHGSGYLHRASLDRLTKGFTTDCVLLRRDAVKAWSPETELRDRFDVYYCARAVFKRLRK